MHSGVGLSRLEKTNSPIVGIANQLRKILLAQIALHLPAIASGAKRQPRNLHARFTQRHPIRRSRALCLQRQSARASQRTRRNSGLDEISPGPLCHLVPPQSTYRAAICPNGITTDIRSTSAFCRAIFRFKARSGPPSPSSLFPVPFPCPCSLTPFPVPCSFFTSYATTPRRGQSSPAR